MSFQDVPRWTEDFTPSGRAASEPPAMFLAAVRARRVKRRVSQSLAGVVALGFVVAATVWSLPVRSGQGRMANREIPVPVVAHHEPEPTPATRGPVGLTLASIYRSGAADERDPALAERGSEPVLRGGDQWDMDRVKAWVLN